jgi:hypothetical protein
MALKLNILFILFVLSLFLFSHSLKNKGSKKLDSSEIEVEKEIKYGMVQDFDQESLVELQLEDIYSSMMDKNSNYMEAPKPEAKPVLKKAKKFIGEDEY